MPYSARYLMCIRYRMNLKCTAFPDRMPEEIFMGFHDHSKPYPGDNGVLYRSLLAGDDANVESTEV